MASLPVGEAMGGSREIHERLPCKRRPREFYAFQAPNRPQPDGAASRTLGTMTAAHAMRISGTVSAHCGLRWFTSTRNGARMSSSRVFRTGLGVVAGLFAGNGAGAAPKGTVMDAMHSAPTTTPDERHAPDARPVRGASVVTAVYLAAVLAAPFLVRYAPDGEVQMLAALTTTQTAPARCAAPVSGRACGVNDAPPHALPVRQ
jgi:hypothetical protein